MALVPRVASDGYSLGEAESIGFGKAWNDMQNTALKRARESAGRGAQWLLAGLQMGIIRGAPPLDAYYKTPCALLGSGHRTEANSVLDFVAARFLRCDGDLDGSGVPWFEQFRIYPTPGSRAVRCSLAGMTLAIFFRRNFFAPGGTGKAGDFAPMRKAPKR